MWGYYWELVEENKIGKDGGEHELGTSAWGITPLRNLLANEGVLPSCAEGGGVHFSCRRALVIPSFARLSNNLKKDTRQFNHPGFVQLRYERGGMNDL